MAMAAAFDTFTTRGRAQTGARRPFPIALTLVALLTCVGVASANDVSKVNGSVRVSAGEQVGDVETVNGSIHIEAGATAKDVETVNGSVQIEERSSVGKVNTVNGGITLGNDAKADSVETVNGKVSLASGVHVAGNITAVNGTFSLERGAGVEGGMTNVNGKMTLEGAHVGRDLVTTNGDITLRAGSRVDGGIVVRKQSSGLFHWHRRNPRIVIGPDAIVTGTLRFEQEVDLYVSDRAKVGAIEGATPVMLTTDAEGNSIPKEQEQKVEK